MLATIIGFAVVVGGLNWIVRMAFKRPAAQEDRAPVRRKQREVPSGSWGGHDAVDSLSDEDTSSRMRRTNSSSDWKST